MEAWRDMKLHKKLLSLSGNNISSNGKEKENGDFNEPNPQ